MMNENEDLISRLRAMGRRPVDTDVAASHLAAMADPAGAGASWLGRHRLKVVAAFAVGLMVGTSGLATAGALPNGAQEVAHRTLGAVGVKVPHGDRYQGPECGGEVKNHGQYVKSQPKEKRAEAAKSRCGKPVQAGTGEGADQPAGTGCQGPPPWAGKGKPDPAAKAARKQACGNGDDSDEKKETPAPAAGAQPAPLTQEPAPTTEPSTPTTDTTATTETTATSETTATTVTTATTSPPQGDTTPTTPADPPVPGLGS